MGTPGGARGWGERGWREGLVYCGLVGGRHPGGIVSVGAARMFVLVRLVVVGRDDEDDKLKQV